MWISDIVSIRSAVRAVDTAFHLKVLFQATVVKLLLIRAIAVKSNNFAKETLVLWAIQLILIQALEANVAVFVIKFVDFRLIKFWKKVFNSFEL